MAPIDRNRPPSYDEEKANPNGDALTIGAGVAGGILTAGLILWIFRKLAS